MKITYLLGAGASAKAIPTYKKDDDLKFNFVSSLRDIKRYVSEFRVDGQLSTIKQKLIENFEWILQSMSSDKFETIDVWAKTIWNDSSRSKSIADDYIRLKSTLSIYFLLVQAKENVDNRYVTWISHIKRKLQLHPNINIVTWNYDVQFEKAYSINIPGLNLEVIHNEFQTIPSVVKKSDLISINNNEFSKIHLNGIAGILKKDSIDSLFSIMNENLSVDGFKVMLSSYEFYLNNPSAIHEVFSYAWESSNLAQKARNESERIFKETNVLIVIGYSFPTLNWQVADLNNFKQLPADVRIYVQDLNYPLIEDILIRRMPELRDKIIEINHENFYIPEDLNFLD